MSAYKFWDAFAMGFLGGMFCSRPNPFAPSFPPVFTPAPVSPSVFTPMFNPLPLFPQVPCCTGGYNLPSVWNYPPFIYPDITSTIPIPALQYPQISADSGFNFNLDTSSLFAANLRNTSGFDLNWGDTFSGSASDKNNTASRLSVFSSALSTTPSVSASSGTSASKASSASEVSSASTWSSKKITDKYTGTAEQLNEYLADKGVLKNKGEAFLKAQEKYGINAIFLIAICVHETGNGKSNLARNKNNVGGVRQGTGFKSYNSVDDCIMDMARFLKSGYADKGLLTISKVGAKYCPVSDPADTKGENGLWASKVTDYAQKIETAIV